MHKKHILLCYDISDKRRLQKLQRHVSQNLLQIQYSIYYGVLSNAQISELIIQIGKIINPHHDDVKLYEVEPLAKAFLVGKRSDDIMLFDKSGERLFW